jgi:hypothetical protein
MLLLCSLSGLLSEIKDGDRNVGGLLPDHKASHSVDSILQNRYEYMHRNKDMQEEGGRRNEESEEEANK